MVKSLDQIDQVQYIWQVIKRGPRERKDDSVIGTIDLDLTFSLQSPR